ncbi:cytochrome P450 [Nocardia suismassiliense]|uniref:Cytochrome P450 n=1 Tax=Nocardia suismassiliense TaxID=2077092 RepID=A0ABW6R0R6_9NOCA
MSQTVGDSDLCPFPSRRTARFDPPAAYSELQATAPFQRVRLASGLPAVLVTRHDHVRRLLDDARLSSDEGVIGYPFLYEGAFASPLKDTFMRTDGESHLRVRRMLAKEFTARRAGELRPAVRVIVDACIDEMEAGGNSADLVAAFAFPVPSSMICRLLGVPVEDRPVFEQNTRAMIDIASTQDQVMGAMGAIMGYLDGLLTRKETEPADDLLSRLVHEQLLAGQIERHELVQIALILLVAGHETTATIIGLGVFALLEHPDQLARLKEQPDLWPSAVEELLRHQTIVQNPVQRVATADIEIEGETIRAGEGVVMVLETANRDPRAYDQPDVLDVSRNPRNHLSFSFGPHHCLGHAIARMELEVVFSRLFERLPGLRLAVPSAEVTMRPPTVGLYGVESLPVAW